MRLNRCLVPMLVALFGVACTSEASPPVSTAQLTTTVAETTTTTEPATTTTTEPTSTAPPTSSQEEIEAELIAVIDGANAIFLADPIDPENPDLDRFYTGDMKERLRLAFERREEAGDRYDGEFQRIAVESVEVDGAEALVIMCGLDAVATLSPAGDVLTQPDEQAFLRLYELVLVDDASWKIREINFGPEKRSCG